MLVFHNVVSRAVFFCDISDCTLKEIKNDREFHSDLFPNAHQIPDNSLTNDDSSSIQQSSQGQHRDALPLERSRVSLRSKGPVTRPCKPRKLQEGHQTVDRVINIGLIRLNVIV